MRGQIKKKKTIKFLFIVDNFLIQIIDLLSYNHFPFHSLTYHFMYLTPSEPSAYYYYCRQTPNLFWVATTKVRFLDIWVSVWVGGSVADVKQPQAVLPTKKITLTLLLASTRPIFRPFCLDAIGVLWHYWAKREVDGLIYMSFHYSAEWPFCFQWLAFGLNLIFHYKLTLGPLILVSQCS